MKKLMILSVAFLFSIPLIFGQIEKKESELIKETEKELKEEKSELNLLEGEDVNDITKDNFYGDFGDVPDVKWKTVNLYSEATFMKDGKEMKAFYDFDSHLIGTTHHIDFAEIPESAKKEIKEKYEDYEIGPVIFFDNLEANPGLVLLYGIQFESEKNYFVELRKGSEKIIVQVLESGVVSYFDDIE